MPVVALELSEHLNERRQIATSRNLTVAACSNVLGRIPGPWGAREGPWGSPPFPPPFFTIIQLDPTPSSLFQLSRYS